MNTQAHPKVIHASPEGLAAIAASFSLSPSQRKPRELSAEEIAEAMLKSDLPAAVHYLRGLKLIQATLEAAKLMAEALEDAPVAMGWGLALDLSFQIGAALHDSDIALEIERISRAIDLKEDTHA